MPPSTQPSISTASNNLVGGKHKTQQLVFITTLHASQNSTQMGNSIQNNLHTGCRLNDKQMRGLLRKTDGRFPTSDARFYNHSLRGISIGGKKMGTFFRKTIFTSRMRKECFQNVLFGKEFLNYKVCSLSQTAFDLISKLRSHLHAEL